MTLTTICSTMMEDHSYCSELYDNLKDSVKQFYEITEEYRKLEGMKAEERKSMNRRYYLAFMQVKKDAEAYREARKDSGETPHMQLCRQLLKELKKYYEISENCNDAAREDFMKDTEENDFLMGMDETRTRAAFAEAEGEIAAERARHGPVPDDPDAFVKKNRRLHKMLDESKSDEDFIRNYIKNREVLAMLMQIGENSADQKRKDMAVNAAMYERYLKNRMLLLKLPDDPDYRKEREDAEKELETLKKLGVKAVHYTPKTADQAYFRNDAKGKVRSTYRAVMERNAAFSHPSKAHIGASAKFRLGKIGRKINLRWLKVSGSLSALKANASANNLPTQLNGMNDLNTTTVNLCASASAYGGKARGKVTIGTKSNHIGFRGQVILGDALAYSKVGALMVKAEEKDDPEKSHQEYGAEAGAGAQASLATIVYGGEISILGVKFSLTNKIRIGAVGAHARKHISTGRIGFSIGLALGFGGDVEFALDWSRAVEKVRNWWRHRKRVAREKTEGDIRREIGRVKVSGKQAQLQLDEAAADDAHLNQELFNASGAYRQVLSKAVAAGTRMKDLEPMKKEADKEYSAAADYRMAALVCADIIRVQRQMNVAADKRLENAMHGSAQIEEVLSRIVQLNHRNNIHLWDSGSQAEPDAGRIRTITQKIMNFGAGKNQIRSTSRRDSLEMIPAYN